MYRRFFKRFLDILLAVFAMPFLVILIIVVAVCIKIDDKGSVFFRGERLGRNGIPFKMLKFRTMKVNASDIRNPDGTTYSGKDDPRLTRIGSFLRTTSIDELPQILNVLVGHMSFVGPRPDLIDQKELYDDCMEKWELRVSVRPGITGYSQARYRGEVEFQKRLERDLFYVNNVKITLDVKIIFWTIASVVRREGVHKEMAMNNTYTLAELVWDAEYFGMPSARLELFLQACDNTFDEILKAASVYKFITIRNQNNNTLNNVQIRNKTNALLVDCNVFFRRDVDDSIVLNEGIYIRNQHEVNEGIINIAKNSFLNTRFYRDPSIEPGKAGGVQSERVKNAFEKKCKYFIVFGSIDTPKGFSLCSQLGDELLCELIAVDAAFARQGIGKKLVEAMHPLARELGVGRLMIPTQADNLAAARLYSLAGFLPSEFHTIYHWWNVED